MAILPSGKTCNKIIFNLSSDYNSAKSFNNHTFLMDPIIQSATFWCNEFQFKQTCAV